MFFLDVAIDEYRVAVWSIWSGTMSEWQESKVFVRTWAWNLAENPAVAVTQLSSAIRCFATLFRYNEHFVSTNSIIDEYGLG